MKRSLTIDLARGFTVFCIAPIHSVLVYSRPYLLDTLMGKAMAFIAEWHGAQIFMFLMGLSITFKDPQPLQSILKRSGMLFGVALLLNAAKFVIPYLFHWLPTGILEILAIDPSDPESHPIIQMVAVADILHFAAIAYLTAAVLYNHKNYGKIALIVAVITGLLSPLFYDMTSCNGLLNYTLNLFTGQPPRTFFPFFPWIIYPLLGLWFGSLLKKEKPPIAFDSLWIPGVALLALVLPLKYFLHDYEFSLFYRTQPLDTALHVASVFIFLSIWNWIVLNVKQNALFQLFTWCSKNITAIYLVQWVLIMWLMPIFAFRKLGWGMSIVAMAITTCLTLALTLATKLAFKKPAKN